LDRVLESFPAKAFEGTSLADLTKAMGINRPSLYATFGIVGELFRKAAGRYHDGTAAHPRQALEEVTARTVVKRLLYGTVELLTDTRTPQGCLTIQVAGGASRKD
jgi:AcrR family transcriptional regulator